MTQRLIQRVELSDEVQRAVASSEDLNETYHLLESAAEFYEQHGRPMTLAEYEQSKSPSVGG